MVKAILITIFSLLFLVNLNGKNETGNTCFENINICVEKDTSFEVLQNSNRDLTIFLKHNSFMNISAKYNNEKLGISELWKNEFKAKASDIEIIEDKDSIFKKGNSSYYVNFFNYKFGETKYLWVRGVILYESQYYIFYAKSDHMEELTIC